jgi:hypothetical protein
MCLYRSLHAFVEQCGISSELSVCAIELGIA